MSDRSLVAEVRGSLDKAVDTALPTLLDMLRKQLYLVLLDEQVSNDVAPLKELKCLGELVLYKDQVEDQ